jgi:hypothetical protein
MDSHARLQYLPFVGSQEQLGWAHFLTSFDAMSSSSFDP